MVDAAANETAVGNVAGQGAPDLPPLRPLDEFHRDPRYAGDLHRADMAWARNAAAMGISAAEIRAGHAGAGSLQEGEPKRQREYAERTADKAVRQAE